MIYNFVKNIKRFNNEEKAVGGRKKVIITKEREVQRGGIVRKRKK